MKIQRRPNTGPASRFRPNQPKPSTNPGPRPMQQAPETPEDSHTMSFPGSSILRGAVIGAALGAAGALVVDKLGDTLISTLKPDYGFVDALNSSALLGAGGALIHPVLERYPVPLFDRLLEGAARGINAGVLANGTYFVLNFSPLGAPVTGAILGALVGGTGAAIGPSNP